MSDKKDKLLILNTHIRNENLLGSWIRNTVILFSLGITLTAFSSNRHKDHIALILFLIGLIIGVISIYNYSMVVKSIQDETYVIPSEYTYNIYSLMFILLVLGVLFIMKLLKYKNKYIGEII